MVAGAFPSLLSAPCPVFQRTPVFFKLPTKHRRFHSVYTHLQAFHAASVDSEVTNDIVGDISASLGQELGTHSQPKAQPSKTQNTIDNINELLGIQTSQALDSSPQSTQSVAGLKAVAASIQVGRGAVSKSLDAADKVHLFSSAFLSHNYQECCGVRVLC